MKVINLIALAAATILTTSCEKENPSQQQDGKTPIIAEASLLVAQVESNTGAHTPQTKNPDIIFVDGAEMNFVVQPELSDGVSNPLKNTGNYAEAKFRYNDALKNCTEIAPAGQKPLAVYPNGVTNVDIYAFYPYQENMFNVDREMDKQEYRINPDQSTALKGDFMIAKVKGKKPESAAAALAFTRQAVKIKIFVHGEDDSNAIQYAKVVVKNVKPAIVYNPNNASGNYVTGATGMLTDFTAKYADTESTSPFIHEIIIPAQSFAANKFELDIYKKVGTTYTIATTVQLETPITFALGKEYELQVNTLGADVLNLTVNAITPWDNQTEEDLGGVTE